MQAIETPQDVMTSAVLTAIRAGEEHTCAITSTAEVACWGHNGLGELGDGTFGDSANPVRATIASVSALELGTYQTCAVAGGLPYCWGLNDAGQLGIGTLDNAGVPTRVAASTGFAAATTVAAGDRFSCGLDPTGAVWCWGDTLFGQLGVGLGWTATSREVAFP